MAFDFLASEAPAQARFNQILAGTDALLVTPATSITPAAGTPLPTTMLALPDSVPTITTSNFVPDTTSPPSVTTLANQTVLALHASLEGTADANGLIGTVHGVTNLGETVGLGHLGTGSNLLTDVASAPGALAAGNTAPLGQLAPDAGAIGTAAEQLLGGAASDAGANPALVSPVAAVLPVATGLASAAPAEALANTAVLDFHQTIEAGADSSGLPGSIHGLTNLGETAGLGHLGTGGNLLSDATGVLSGNTGSPAALPADIGNVAAAAGQLASGVAADLSSGAFLANPVGNTLAFAQALPAFPAASLANGAIDTVHATLEGAADPVAPGTIHGVTGLGNAVGLGEIGGANALTDVATAPTSLLSGNTAPLTQLPADVASIGTAAGTALTGAASDLSQGSLAGAITHPASGSGLLAGDLPGQGVLQSVGDPLAGTSGSLPLSGLPTDPAASISGVTTLANQAVLALHASLESTADANGLIGTVHGVTNLGETVGLGHLGTGSNLLTDVASAPGALAAGNTAPLGQLAPDAGAIGTAAEQLLGGAASDAGANPALVSPVAAVLPVATGLASAAPAEALANTAVLDFHQTIEAGADSSGLPGSIHGLTNLGETAGLGHLGTGGNLLSDATGVLSGNTGSPAALPADIGNVAAAAGQLASGVAADLSSGAFLANPVGNTLAFAQALPAFPAASLANGAIDTVHATLEGAADPVAPGTIHGVTGLGNAVGLGEIGGANALTDVATAPTSLLSGNTAPLTQLPADVASIGTAAGTALTGAASDLSQGSLAGAITHPASGSGLLAGDLPGQGVGGSVVSEATGALNSLGDATGTASVTQAATSTVGAATGLAGGVAHVPGDAVAGASSGAAPLAGEAGVTLSSAGTIVAAAADTAAHNGADSVLGSAAAPVASIASEASSTASSVASVATASAESVTHDVASAATSLAPAAVADATTATSTAASGLVDTGTATAHDVTASAGTIAPAAVADVSGTAADLATTISGTAAAVTSPADAATTAAASTLSHTADAAGGALSSASDATAAAAHAASGAVDTVAATVAPVASTAATDLSTATTGVADTVAHAATAAPTDIVAATTDTVATAAHDATTAIDTAATPVAALSGTAASDLGASAATVADAASHAAAAPAEAAAAVTMGAAAGTGTVATAADTASAATHDVAAAASSLASTPAAAATIASAPADAVLHAVSGATSALPTVATPTAASGAHDAASVAVGPQTATGGTSVDVLSSGSGGTHLVTTSAGTATAPTPTVAAVSVLPDTLHFPAATGGGSDALTGALSSVATPAPAASDALAHTGVDLTAVHVDVPVAAAHADPLASLAHAVHA